MKLQSTTVHKLSIAGLLLGVFALPFLASHTSLGSLKLPSNPTLLSAIAGHNNLTSNSEATELSSDQRVNSWSQSLGQSFVGDVKQ